MDRMHVFTKLAVFILVVTICSAATETSKILVLGGNGMLGSATVRSLLNQTAVNYDITIVNRGNWYWDTEKIIKPYVKHVACERGDNFREDCTQLHDVTFDTIIDFSTYDPLDMEDILILLGGKFKRYIYISSDSVYEVCEEKSHDGFSKEEDAIRPQDEILSEQLSKKDNYGHKKYEGEEVLERFHQEIGYEYISLRLPDVLGPRDNTIRFYKYFIWTKMHEAIPIHLPPLVRNRPLSFVYSLDVGKLIASLAYPGYPSNVFNHAYNLGFKETITLKEMITFIADWLKNGPTKFDESDAAYINHGFPSVSLGPVDTTKATIMLNWAPTNIYKALIELCEFYEGAQYNLEYKHIIDRVLDKLEIRGDKYRDFIELHWEKLKKEEL